MYNHSLRSLDRTAHLKIALVPLIASALLTMAMLNLRAEVAYVGVGAGAKEIVRAGHASDSFANRSEIVIR